MPDGERVKVPCLLFSFLVRSTVRFKIIIMRTRSEKKAGIRRPDVRSLRIQPKIRFNRWSTSTAPEIKLCGSWLEELSFHHGSRVVITTMKELIIIRLQTGMTV